MYKEYKKFNFLEIDQDIFKFWEDYDIFNKSVEQCLVENNFVFYEGLFLVNGKFGIYYVMACIVKDFFCCYYSMKGQCVECKGGWDIYGLFIELNVEKEFGIIKEDIGIKIMVEEYNVKCCEIVMCYKDMWDNIICKMGYWVDFDNFYIIFENDYIEMVWWLLQQLYNKGLFYKGFIIQFFLFVVGIGLSFYELNMFGIYQDIKDIFVIV